MHVILGLAVAMSAMTDLADAQEIADSVRLRNDCRLAAQVLITGQPAPRPLGPYGR
jgi:hypothetical protein